MAENSKAVSKEEELKKLSKVNMIRSLLPIIGLVAVFVIFNVLMWQTGTFSIHTLCHIPL